jgi:hypothetical protein
MGLVFSTTRLLAATQIYPTCVRYLFHDSVVYPGLKPHNPLICNSVARDKGLNIAGIKVDTPRLNESSRTLNHIGYFTDA